GVAWRHDEVSVRWHPSARSGASAAARIRRRVRLRRTRAAAVSRRLTNRSGHRSARVGTRRTLQPNTSPVRWVSDPWTTLVCGSKDPRYDSLYSWRRTLVLLT